ncbi:hypothetical protein PPERSA_01286 [Pseudocohnilembus persalinus]|uniref:Uncharacterized protein n=1 Tax=Pseudocohnilembus persalinus TaxID=266149 RepID=A0A0V0QGS0_PSEPJ|nr:hypothetical protein PPERSA_01286 [Pseudocohnilembus persalinus]|eukprot:KRX01383.1 hypothetical protein PPERSA_01286 [Pseudocohnilembus persalinus]
MRKAYCVVKGNQFLGFYPQKQEELECNKEQNSKNQSDIKSNSNTNNLQNINDQLNLQKKKSEKFEEQDEICEGEYNNIDKNFDSKHQMLNQKKQEELAYNNDEIVNQNQFKNEIKNINEQNQEIQIAKAQKNQNQNQFSQSQSNSIQSQSIASTFQQQQLQNQNSNIHSSKNSQQLQQQSSTFPAEERSFSKNQKEYDFDNITDFSQLPIKRALTKSNTKNIHISQMPVQKSSQVDRMKSVYFGDDEIQIDREEKEIDAQKMYQGITENNQDLRNKIFRKQFTEYFGHPVDEAVPEIKHKYLTDINYDQYYNFTLKYNKLSESRLLLKYQFINYKSDSSAQQYVLEYRHQYPIIKIIGSFIFQPVLGFQAIQILFLGMNCFQVPFYLQQVKNHVKIYVKYWKYEPYEVQNSQQTNQLDTLTQKNGSQFQFQSLNCKGNQYGNIGETNNNYIYSGRSDLQQEEDQLKQEQYQNSNYLSSMNSYQQQQQQSQNDGSNKFVFEKSLSSIKKSGYDSGIIKNTLSQKSSQIKASENNKAFIQSQQGNFGNLFSQGYMKQDQSVYGGYQDQSLANNLNKNAQSTTVAGKFNSNQQIIQTQQQQYSNSSNKNSSKSKSNSGEQNYQDQYQSSKIPKKVQESRYDYLETVQQQNGQVPSLLSQAIPNNSVSVLGFQKSKSFINSQNHTSKLSNQIPNQVIQEENMEQEQ